MTGNGRKTFLNRKNCCHLRVARGRIRDRGNQVGT
jgi:hypothetical protein